MTDFFACVSRSVIFIRSSIFLPTLVEGDLFISRMKKAFHYSLPPIRIPFIIFQLSTIANVKRCAGAQPWARGKGRKTRGKALRRSIKLYLST